MPAMFGTTLLHDDCQIQNSPCFEGRCDCPRILGMEHQSPTPPLSRPGSILTACDRELTSPPELSPLWTVGNETAFKREDSHNFAADLQRALNDVDSRQQPPEEDFRQYTAIRDIQPPYHESSPLQFFQFPQYQHQQQPSYVSYQNHPCGPLSPAPTNTSESPGLGQFSQAYIWPIQQEARGPFDDRRGDTYYAGSPENEEDEMMCDKPYARLIYDALMQAPGHRMMLREIYEWFQRNTTKPAESGTNGWQNSIRHNLSMNQAFENDKSDQANAPGQKQKVNSVWVLTDNAVRNGVQSTTRYRKIGKIGNGKRMNNNKTPAPLRQRSGARGGEAARRTMRLRKKEHHHQHGLHLAYPQAPMYDYEGSGCDGASSDAFSILDPTTPIPDFSFGGDPSYQTPRFSTEPITSPTYRSSNHTCIGDPDLGMHDYGYQSGSELNLEDMLSAHQDSTASNLST